jgi:hypothetical protein
VGWRIRIHKKTSSKTMLSAYSELLLQSTRVCLLETNQGLCTQGEEKPEAFHGGRTDNIKMR